MRKPPIWIQVGIFLAACRVTSGSDEGLTEGQSVIASAVFGRFPLPFHRRIGTRSAICAVGPRPAPI